MLPPTSGVNEAGIGDHRNCTDSLRTGGVVVATYRKLLKEGLIDPSAEVVLLNTGDGLKTLDAVAPTSQPTFTISPSYDDFEANYTGDNA